LWSGIDEVYFLQNRHSSYRVLGTPNALHQLRREAPSAEGRC
jgi:hypothetical protein